MIPWYSRRGARRGLAVAALFGACWLSWAAGYLQGVSASHARPASDAHPTRSNVRADLSPVMIQSAA